MITEEEERPETRAAGINSVAELIAHACAFENEAAERYAELAAAMKRRASAEVADVFRKLSNLQSMHAADINRRAAGLDLPRVPPWPFPTAAPARGPETVSLDAFREPPTPAQALRLALVNEQRGHAFYAAVAARATDPEVKQIAEEMAEEELEHVALVEAWLERFFAAAGDG
jgi:rubrerythrin